MGDTEMFSTWNDFLTSIVIPKELVDIISQNLLELAYDFNYITFLNMRILEMKLQYNNFS